MPFKKIDTAEGRVILNTDHVIEGLIKESPETPGNYRVGVLMTNGKIYMREGHEWTAEKDAILALERFLTQTGDHSNLTNEVFRSGPVYRSVW